MKTYIFAIAVVVIVIASMTHASCVKVTLAKMGTINIALNGGR